MQHNTDKRFESQNKEQK